MRVQLKAQKTAERFGRDDLPLHAKVTDLTHTQTYENASRPAEAEFHAAA